MKIKNIYLTILAILSLSILSVTSNIAKAEFRAGPGNGSIEITCSGEGKHNCGSDSGKLQLVGYVGDLYISVYSKPFNFIRTDNGAGLVNGDSVPVGVKLNFSTYGNAVGSWFVSGGGYDTPDMGSGENLIPDSKTKDRNGRINVEAPNTSNPINIIGNGKINCNGLTCTTTGEGPASITVVFPGSSVRSTSAPKYPNQSKLCSQNCTTYSSLTSLKFLYSLIPNNEEVFSTNGACTPGGDRWACLRSNKNTSVINTPLTLCKYGKDCGQDIENISYGNQTATIYFNVYNPNTPPIVNYTNTDNIAYNTAKANWTYRDNESDPQVDSHIQLAVDANFNSIVFNSSQGGQSNNFNLIDLIPGTTYYPRVRSQDSRGAWSDWSNGQAFTTLANTPPNIADFGCSVSKVMAIPDKYTTANVQWNYTGQDPDGLILTLRYKKPSDYIWSENTFLANNSGSLSQGGLIAGNNYQIQIALTDKYNKHIKNQIKNCGNIDIDQYPDPKVTFTLSNGNKTSTAQKGGTLTIGQSDGVLSSWDITDTFGLIDNSCKITTTNISGGVNSQIFNQFGLGFKITDLPGQNIPQFPQDLEYNINLKCEGKNANPKKEVNENIRLKVISIPVVSCNLNKKVVDINSSTVDLTANIGNVSDYYDFKIGKNLGEAPIDSGRITLISSNQSILNKTIDYKGIPFGNYKPFIEITSKSGKTVSKTCGNITNFGNSKIKEVNP